MYHHSRKMLNMCHRKCKTNCYFKDQVGVLHELILIKTILPLLTSSKYLFEDISKNYLSLQKSKRSAPYLLKQQRQLFYIFLTYPQSMKKDKCEKTITKFSSLSTKQYPIQKNVTDYDIKIETNNLYLQYYNFSNITYHTI